MADDWNEYRSTHSVHAEQVTAEEGESVITHGGVIFADKGSYKIREKTGEVHVMDQQSFESLFTDNEAQPPRDPETKSDDDEQGEDAKPASPAERVRKAAAR